MCVKCAIKWVSTIENELLLLRSHSFSLSTLKLLHIYIFVLLSLLIYYYNKVYLCDLKWTVIVSVFYFCFFFTFCSSISSFLYKFNNHFNYLSFSLLYSSLLTETIVSCDLIRLWISYALSLHIQFKSKSYLIRVDELNKKRVMMQLEHFMRKSISLNVWLCPNILLASTDSVSFDASNKRYVPRLIHLIRINWNVTILLYIAEEHFTQVSIECQIELLFFYTESCNSYTIIINEKNWCGNVSTAKNRGIPFTIIRWQ